MDHNSQRVLDWKTSSKNTGIGTTFSPRPKLIDELRRLFNDVKIVDAAFCGELRFENKKRRTHLIFGIKLSPGSENQFQTIDERVRYICELMKTKDPVDIIRITNDNVGLSPFYSKDALVTK